MKACWDLKHNLVQSLPSCMEEWLRQPLVMNPLFLSKRGEMLGKRTRLIWTDFDRGEVGLVRNWPNFLLRRWKTKPNFVAQFGVETLCIQKSIECLICIPFRLLKVVYFGMVCFHLYRSCWGSGVIKTLMTVFISMFGVLDGFILSFWKTKLYLTGVCCCYPYRCTGRLGVM